MGLEGQEGQKKYVRKMSLPDRAWGNDDCVENVGNVSGSYGGNRSFRYSCPGILQITTEKLLLK